MIFNTTETDAVALVVSFDLSDGGDNIADIDDLLASFDGEVGLSLVEVAACLVVVKKVNKLLLGGQVATVWLQIFECVAEK